MPDTILTNSELANIRREIERLLPDSCHIMTVVETRNASGGVLETWGTATAATACRFDPLRGSEELAAGAVTAFHGYTVTMPYDTAVTTKNRISWNGRVFEIVSVDADKSWKSSLRLRVEAL